MPAYDITLDQKTWSQMMTTSQLLDELTKLSNPERLMVIEAATRLVRDALPDTPLRQAEEDRLRIAAERVKDLYEPGGELTEWTALDAEEVLDDYVQR